MSLKGRLHDFREWVIPLLNQPDGRQVAADAERLSRDLASVEAQGWTAHPDVALDEARRIFDAEMARRASADAKATTYIAVIAALVPIGLSVQGAVVENKIGTAPSWVNLLILAAGMLYVIGAGIWAFRALKVSGAARADIPDVLRAWKRRDPRIHMIRTTLKAARLNWSSVNDKVTFIRMAHEYLMRAFVTFSLLLIVNAAWTLASSAVNALRIHQTAARQHRDTSTSHIPACPSKASPHRRSGRTTACR
ncbi:hypothetical protein [Sphingomonas fuzhouensis]|uniref:hypothetical protein n=1 Tax=Sphingomonas fuzhouensis TaxID=3106033 RepID=UPI002AFF6613|nr:hypothetical protein [Sphingomonas sp. SGZ-02]